MEGLGPSTVVPDFKPKVSQEEFESTSLSDHDFSCFNSTVSPEVTHIQGDDVLYIDGILTEMECRFLIESIDKSPHLSFWSHKGREDDETRAYRNVDTMEVEYHRLADSISERLRHCLSLPPLEIDASEGRDLIGTWAYSSLNHDCLLSRYPPYGSFAPHTDGKAVHHFDRRSFYSVVIFLNTIPQGYGGGTRFYSHMNAIDQLERVRHQDHSIWTGTSTLILHEVVPRVGRMLIFKQHLVHEGVPPLESYQKYIIRSDLMYDRNPALLKTKVDQEAYQIYQRAEQLSEIGDTNESIVLFRKALKMSPTLAEILGQ